MKTLIVALVLAVGVNAFAYDRSQVVQSRIQATLSSILSSSDFLVVVNRSESLDAALDTGAAEGSVKALPGLGVGLDSRGEVVAQGTSGSSYLGPVVARVIIDEKVSPKTFQLIQGLLSEIAGGSQDADEVTIVRGTIRQDPKAVDQRPQINIQNMPPQRNEMQENLKFLFLFLMTAGALFLILARAFRPASPTGHSVASDAPAGKDGEISPVRRALDFSVIDSRLTAFCLTHFLKNNELEKVRVWRSSVDSGLQRSVFQHLPAWLLSHLQLKLKGTENPSATSEKYSAEELFSELARIEQSLKTEGQRIQAFLQWFPAEALRFVSANRRNGVSQSSRNTLWSLRSDLGSFTATNDPASMPAGDSIGDEELQDCYRELLTLPSTEFEKGANTEDVVARWAATINQLTEFSPIDAQLEQARTKLKPEEYGRLEQLIVSVRTPLLLNDDQRKAWLRSIEPDDYVWWKHTSRVTPDWDLARDLRPLKRAAFRQAESENSITGWNELQKKAASQRLLTSLRAAYFGDRQDEKSA